MNNELHGAEHSGKTGFLSSMSPSQVFTFGIIQGVMTLCTIGFFIMLGVYFKETGTIGNTGGRVAVAAPSADDGGDQVPTDISVRPVDIKNDHIRGNKDAKISIVVYSDYECPFCKNFHETMQQVIAKYGNDVRWIYRHFPLDSLHRQARQEALAGECAGEQGKFWEYSDLVFQETQSNDGLDLTKLPAYAKQLAMNVTKFNDCVSSQKYADVVQQDEQDAQAAGGQGTPYSVIIGPNGETLPINGAQPFASVEAALQTFLN